MPFKSKAQQGKLEAMASRGQFPKKKLLEFETSTDYSKLPIRVAGKKVPLSRNLSKIRPKLKKR